MVTAVSSPVATTLETKPSIISMQAPRLVSVDVLRGLVMVLMALDHTRDFMTGLRFPPEDLAHTYGALFFTRVITHYCAPVFAFLAGTGAFLSTRRGKSIQQVSRFFLTRGLWLVLLELTVVDFAWGFVPWAHGGVIWILGWSMVAMALIVRLPVRWIAVLGLGMIATHNLLDGINPGSFGRLSWLWILLHSRGRIPLTADFSFTVRYALIPWVGVMAAGYAFGKIYQMDVARRRRWLLAMGGSATVLFIVIRAINIYGDPARWATQKNAIFTVLSFLNTTKYPPSLLFLLMTLGPAMMALALFESAINILGPLRNPLVTFGRVPLFFYILQWYTAHLIAIALGWLAGQPVAFQWASPIDKFTQPAPPGVGFRLWVVYLCWLGGVLLLYPLCKWFAGVKARRRDWWLSYL